MKDLIICVVFGLCSAPAVGRFELRGHDPLALVRGDRDADQG